jgi:hypothetical protein
MLRPGKTHGKNSIHTGRMIRKYSRITPTTPHYISGKQQIIRLQGPLTIRNHTTHAMQPSKSISTPGITKKYSPGHNPATKISIHPRIFRTKPPAAYHLHTKYTCNKYISILDKPHNAICKTGYFYPLQT